MAKLPTPTGKSLNLGDTIIAYADGIDEVDQHGPNSQDHVLDGAAYPRRERALRIRRITFWMAQRIPGESEPSNKIAVATIVELVRIARQLCTLEDNPGEQPAPKQVVTLQ
jgi:hypothetical protein